MARKLTVEFFGAFCAVAAVLCAGVFLLAAAKSAQAAKPG